LEGYCSSAERIFNKLLGVASVLLGGHDEDCANWFGTAARVSGLNLAGFLNTVGDLMGHIEVEGNPRIGGVTGSNLTLAFGRPIYFNTKGAFFRDLGPRTIGEATIQSDSDRMRAMIMLHEWAHLLEAPGFLRDGPSSTLPAEAQNFNNALLFDRCRRTINSFSNRPR
jgi:hypothetical protein